MSISIKTHGRTSSQAYSDENTHMMHGGVHKAASGAAFGLHDAKRGKIATTTLPTTTRPALGDISNRTAHPPQDGGVKKAPSVTSFPSVHPARLQEQVAAPQPQMHSSSYLPPQHQAAPMQQTVDPMDTTLEDSVADLSINPTASTVAASSASAYAPAAAPYIAVDEADKLNAQMCSEYGPEIQAYWRASEMRRAPSPTYMSKQNDINPKMREILVDWMVEVQLKFKLKEETLFLAIHILDRFLERRLVSRTKLQLVGCTSLLLAAKYEEIYAPEVADFVAISDKAYAREQIIAMEGIMLNALSFNLTVPLPINFLQRFARLGGVEQGDQVWCLAMYFMELTLQSYAFLNFPPSQIAASALYLAMGTAQAAMGLSHLPVWTHTQSSQIEYTPAQLSTCLTEMFKLVEHTQNGLSKYKAVKKKYTLPKFHEVAKYNCRAPVL